MHTENPIINRLTAADFVPATDEEKQSAVQMRESVGFWKDGFRRLKRNPVSMGALAILILMALLAYVVPYFYPYNYYDQMRGSENLGPMQYSADEMVKKENGEKLFPHILGTDNLGRDYSIRVMVGARISMTVGIVAAVLILFIGSLYGTVSSFLGGWVDLIMMRVVDIIYSIPTLLIVILLMVTLRFPLSALAEKPGFGWINTLGVGLICIFITLGLLDWPDLARQLRAKILVVKEEEFVTAARALGGKGGRISTKHILPNCMGILIIMTSFQIPNAIFTETFLSFIGLGVSAPMPSLGSLCTYALDGVISYPLRLVFPAIAISLIILAFNLLGDGFRDAFDPKLKG